METGDYCLFIWLIGIHIVFSMIMALCDIVFMMICTYLRNNAL